MPPTTPADEQPLTQEELDALALVQNAMAPDVLRRKAAAIAGRLYDAMQTGKQSETAPAADIVANKKKDDRKCHDNTCSKHGKWTALGTFDSLKGICGKPIRMNKWIGIKGKGKHRMKNPTKTATAVLQQNDFSVPYEGKKGVVNVYAALQTATGVTKYAKVGLNTESGEVATVFYTSKTDYEKARKKSGK